MKRTRLSPATPNAEPALCLDGGALPVTPRAVELLATLLVRVAERERAAGGTAAGKVAPGLKRPAGGTR